MLRPVCGNQHIAATCRASHPFTVEPQQFVRRDFVAALGAWCREVEGFWVDSAVAAHRCNGTEPGGGKAPVQHPWEILVVDQFDLGVKLPKMRLFRS
jgi:hypothetical protein